LFFLPRLDRSTDEKVSSRIVVVLAGLLLLACWLFLSI